MTWPDVKKKILCALKLGANSSSIEDISSLCYHLTFPLFLLFSDVDNCYKEDKHDRRFSISPGNYDPLQMTIITCTMACGELNQKYAALTYGKFCFCGNNDPDDAKKTTSGCTTPCSGDSNQMCGDSEHISVYKSAQHFTDLTLSVKSHNNFEVIFEAMAEPESIIVDYQMDYGEGNSRTQKNASDLFTKHYVLPGNFAATLYASGRNNTAPVSTSLYLNSMFIYLGVLFKLCFVMVIVEL